jgi:hypothetical protein
LVHYLEAEIRVKVVAVDLLGDLAGGKILEQDVPCGVLLHRDSCDVPRFGSAADGRGFAVVTAKRAAHGGLLVQ